MTHPLFLSFPALIVFAGSYDIFSKTISNRLCAAIVLAFLPAAASLGLSAAEIAPHFSCAFMMLCAGFALFSAGWIGGGDAKLFAAAAMWFGWGEIAEYAADFGDDRRGAGACRTRPQNDGYISASRSPCTDAEA